jgi:hypothetical protein
MNAWADSAPSARQDRSGPGWTWLFYPAIALAVLAVARRIGGTERFPAVDRALARLGSGDRTRPPTDRALHGLGVLATPGATVGVTRTARCVLTHFSER